MIILMHVTIALLSVAVTGLTYLSPTKGKLGLSYVLVALTVISGTYLVVTRPAHMAATCVEGLVYLAVVSAGIVAARAKLARSA